MASTVIGIDVGGTNVKMGLVNQEGRIFFKTTLDTKSYNSKEKLIRAVADALLTSLQKNKIQTKSVAGIGIGLPGLIDPPAGVVKFLPNIPGWKNVPLKEQLEKHTGIPVFLENDVNMITLGEWKFGAGKGLKDIVCITLGTGVGGGLILDGRLYRGAGYAAGEAGHIPVNEDGPKCNCGGWACLENYVGNQYLNGPAARRFGRKSMAMRDVGDLARAGDKRALAFWDEVGTHLGNGLTGVVNLLNPTHIVVGGGMANNSRFIFPAVKKRIKERAMMVQGRMVKVIRAKLGDDAGIIGAKVLVEEMVSRTGR